MNTFDVIQQYCEQKFSDEERRRRQFNALARQELLDAEEKFGKSFFAFSVEEIIEYINSLVSKNVKHVRGVKISQGYVRNICTYYRDIFNYYMAYTGNYFYNPFSDRRIRHLGVNIKNDTPVFTRGTLERITLSIGEHLDNGEAQFVQLLLWLAYSGCFDVDEIMNIQEDDVDLIAKTAKIEDRTIRLKDECVELLKINRSMGEYTIYKRTNYLIPYHNSFVYFPFCKSFVSDQDPYEYAYEQQQARERNVLRNVISRLFTKVRERCRVSIQLELIYYRGLYDFIVERCGTERTAELLSVGKRRVSSEDVAELESYLAEYGGHRDIFQAKGRMRRFIDI